MNTFHGKTLSELWDIVRSIPRGRVMSYGEVGLRLAHPASGFMVGRWMAQCPEGVPWWRVVAKTGALPIGKRHHQLMSEQEERLRAEGVAFVIDGLIDMPRARFE